MLSAPPPLLLDTRQTYPQVDTRWVVRADASRSFTARPVNLPPYYRLARGRLTDASNRSASTMILPKVRDPRFVTIRRGGTLTDSDRHLLALWAASCAELVLDLFEAAQPEDPRPRQAIEHARAWVRSEVNMTRARAA